jgi:hypothetical protein
MLIGICWLPETPSWITQRERERDKRRQELAAAGEQSSVSFAD